jgi:hypothetical protein
MPAARRRSARDRQWRDDVDRSRRRPKLGAVSLTAQFTAEERPQGAGTVSVGAQKFDVTLALQRARAEAIQPHVEQRIDYFVGRWRYSAWAQSTRRSAGRRSGTMTFTRVGASNFVAGRLEGELFGKPIGNSCRSSSIRRRTCWRLSRSGPTAWSPQRRELAQPDRDHVPDVAGAGQREDLSAPPTDVGDVGDGVR